MSVTPSQVNEMAKLIAAMNAATEGPSAPAPRSHIHETARPDTVIRTAAPLTPDTAAMAKIMDAFSSATNDMVATADTFPELKKALVTEATATGSRVGSWEIDGRSIEGLGKFYNVTHRSTQEPIASDLRLYEAALALVNALNEGATITSSKVKSILNFEEEYARNLTDAVGYASRMKVTEGQSYDVAEARYSEAKRRALSAKKSLSAFTRL